MASNPTNLIRRLFPTNRRLLVEKSLRNLDMTGQKKVLVVGAGHDPYRHYFGELDMYFRLDIECTPGATDIRGDAKKLPIQEGSVDCVVAIEVLEHIDDPFQLVKELDRVLKPSGVVILSVPFMFHEHGDPFDYWRPTHFSLESLFSGFSKISISPQGNRLHVILDLLTTAFNKIPILFPFRIINHLIVHIPLCGNSSAPSGFLLVANK